VAIISALRDNPLLRPGEREEKARASIIAVFIRERRERDPRKYQGIPGARMAGRQMLVSIVLCAYYEGKLGDWHGTFTSTKTRVPARTGGHLVHWFVNEGRPL